MKTILKDSLLIVAMLLALTACKKEIINEIIPGTTAVIDTLEKWRRDEFDNALTTMPDCIQKQTAIETPEQTGAPYNTTMPGGWSCEVTPMRVAPGFDFIKIFQPDNLHVSGWLNGSEIQTGQWSTIPINYFAPRKISINMRTTDDSPASEIIQNPVNHSEYIEAHNKLVNRAIPNSTAAYVSYDIDEIHSVEQAASKIGVSGGGWGAKIAGQFEWGSKDVRSRLMIRFVQKYYDISMDLPTNPSDWFTSLPDYTKLEPYCPTYVSSISYGRMVYVLIESRSSMEETRKAVQASYSGFGYDFNFNYSKDNYSKVEIKSIKSFIAGGSTNFLNATDMGDIGKIISSGASFSQNSPGVPIAFTVRKVKDNSIVNFVTMADYKVQECVQTGIPVTVNASNKMFMFNPKLEIGGDDDYGGCVTIYGNISLVISQDQTRILAYVNTYFDECGGGDTKGRLDPADSVNIVELYTAPLGKTIRTIDVNAQTTFNYTDTDYNNPSHNEFNLPIKSAFIDHVAAIGDTDGPDLPGTGNRERSYLKVYFKNFDITVSF